MYYGQEMYLSGGHDPRNREALWEYGYNGNDLIKKLNELRHIAISKDPKYITTIAKYLYDDRYQLFYQKRSILVGLNGQGALRNIAPYEMRIRGTTYATGEELIEILSCDTSTAGVREVKVVMKNGAPVVLYPKSLLVGTGICGL